jgi:Tfp pilus assembly protein PilW
MMRRIAAVRASGDAGVSLVELMVTVIVGAIVLALVGGFFVQTVRVTTNSNQSRVTTGYTINAENRLTNAVRVISQSPLSDGTTPSIASAGPQSMVFYSYGNTAVSDQRLSKFTITVTAAKRLQVQQCTGTFNGTYWTYPCSATTSTTVVYPGFVVDPVSANAELPLFAFYDSNRAQVASGVASLSSTQIASITSIAVSVKLKTTAAAADSSAVYVTNTVGMPNIALVQSGNGS